MTGATARITSPPVVYLPCVLDRDGQLAEAKMVRLSHGRVALMAYSALDRLARACGDAHPWVLYRSEQLDELRAVSPFDAAYLDVALPVAMRQTKAGA